MTRPFQGLRKELNRKLNTGSPWDYYLLVFKKHGKVMVFKRKLNAAYEHIKHKRSAAVHYYEIEAGDLGKFIRDREVQYAD